MSERQRYTAQEMRDMAQFLQYNFPCSLYRDASAMLRQSADGEDELARLNESKNRWMQYQETAAGERNACIDELRKKDAEITQLKVRLEAVVKYAEENTWDESGEKNAYLDTTTRIHNHDMRAILRAARGEGGAK